MKLNRVLLLFIITLFPCLEARADKLYLVKFGESLYPSELTNRLGSTSIKMGWYFYYFEKESIKILIDSGMLDLKNVSKFRIKKYQSPQELLLKKGITPDSITDIFITHSHFDHIEGVLKFPNAKIHIQSLEYNQFKKSSYYKINENLFLKKETDKLVILYNGESTIYEMIKLIPTGGHTVGSQAIEVITDKLHYLFTGDECYYVEECKKGVGTFPKALYSSKKNILFMKKVQDYLINSKVKIFTMHDPELENEIEVIE
jgi:glyoxylase-like metal-dependent hydrolase (beta-lactamase superfamily II)